ncbi:MAG: hypothetical protein WC120_05440 [Parcubacteria group bacterium]|jgi:hypothetical protein
MSFIGEIKKFAVIVWGAISYALTILPRILSALDALGLTGVKETLIEGIRRGGMQADDYIEENADKLLHVASVFSAISDWASERAALFMDIHEEGTKVREPGVDDALTPDVIADFVRRLLDVDNTADIQAAIQKVTPDLVVAASAKIRGDVSQSPTLDA